MMMIMNLIAKFLKYEDPVFKQGLLSLGICLKAQ